MKEINKRATKRQPKSMNVRKKKRIELQNSDELTARSTRMKTTCKIAKERKERNTIKDKKN